MLEQEWMQGKTSKFINMMAFECIFLPTWLKLGWLLRAVLQYISIKTKSVGGEKAVSISISGIRNDVNKVV